MLQKEKELSKEQTILSRFLSNFPFLGYLSPQKFKGFMMSFDIFVIAGAFLMANFIKSVLGPVYSLSTFHPAHIILLPSFIIIWVCLLYFLGMYTSFKSKKTQEILFILVKTFILGIILWNGYLYILNIDLFTTRFKIFTYLLTASFIGFEKLGLIFLFRYQSKTGINFRNILIAGSGDRVKRFIDLNNKNAEWPIKIVGIVNEEEKVGAMIENYKVIGSFNDLPKIIDECVVDEVVFILPRKLLSEIEEHILLCEKMGVKILVAADLFSPSIAKLKAMEVYDMPFLSIDTTPYNVFHLFVKRLLDFLISLIALVISFPVFVVIAVAIKLSSPVPVFFKQKRVGLRGRIFTLYKFRSMIVEAEDMLSEVKGISESDGPVFHSRKDPRVTSIGRFLRMTSLDELPQFFNVLMGDMSLIGPRPPMPEEVKKYEAWQKRRLSLRPGIVCTWQVTKRFQPNFNEWIKMDLDYIDNWSLGLDFKILLKVPTAILKGIHYWLSGK